MADGMGDSLNVNQSDEEAPAAFTMDDTSSMTSSMSVSSSSYCGSPAPSRSPTSHRACYSNVEEMGHSGLWVFGYGSLCWHQGFQFSETMTGCVQGVSRRFWQGNTTHRGTDGKPGRVATLVEDSEGVVWGQAFKVTGEAALPYLNNRECDLGGYRTTLSTFHPRHSSTTPFPVILYVATPSSRHWLGDSPLTDIAEQILCSSGGSGHNVEYLLRLADFVRETFPEATDDHLFGLEALVLEGVSERKMCLKTLMGEPSKKEPLEALPQVAQMAQPDGVAAAPVASTSQFSSRVPSKHLRCVNI